MLMVINKKHVIIQTKTGFQTPCKDVFGPQKPTQKAKPEQVWLEN